MGGGMANINDVNDPPDAVLKRETPAFVANLLLTPDALASLGINVV